MGDEEEETEPKYELYVQGSDKPREDGSQKFTGQGRAAYLNGDGYNGTYVEGIRAGKGVYTFKKFGDSYEGAYQENRKHGFGKMTYRNNRGGDEEEEPPEEEENAVPRGGSYLGHFTAGQRGRGAESPPETLSEGTFSYVNRDIYVGQWQDGKKHGQGSYTYAKDGTKLVGEWVTGKIVSGKWIFPNGTFYSGRFRYNKPFGKGVWVFQNGNQLTGAYDQKEQVNEDDPPPEDEEGGAPKPDPKVWCQFKAKKSVAVRGGSMFYPKLGA